MFTWPLTKKPKPMKSLNSSRIKSVVRKTKMFFFPILALVVSSSCEDFIKVDPPKTELNSQTVFENDMTATAAIVSLYGVMTFANGERNSITVVSAFSSDELTLFENTINLQQFYANNIVPTNSTVLGIWSDAYSFIYQANSIIEGLGTSQKVSDALKKQLIGEAKFIRAFWHFYLANLFGDVPYIATTDYRRNTAASRIPMTEIYQLAISDLRDAKNLLSDEYPSSERVRPNKWAAIALLAKVYLFAKDYVNAENEATLIINNAKYSLSALNEVFKKNSSEAIWQLRPNDSNRNTNEGNLFILTTAPSFCTLSDDLLGSFEDGDLRMNSWVGSFEQGDNKWYFPFKYKIKTGGSPLSEYSMVLRLAEQYLIRGEARAWQDKLTDAIYDIDSIRNRAGLSLIQNTNPTIEKSDLLLAFEQERRVELFTEWGNRWLDLKRTGRTDDVLNPIKPSWETTDELYPIPESEILVNVNLRPQNSGYN
jgi:hypothetical protein